jgi:flavodoxin
MDPSPCLVLCKSPHHGNTARVAAEICAVLGCTPYEPESTPVGMASECGLLGVGSGVYYGRMHAGLFAWLLRLPDAAQRSKLAFIYSTSGLPFLSDLWHRPLRRLLSRKGYDVVGEFACRGFDTWGPLWFTGGLNRQHPDERDLARAHAFAEKLPAANLPTWR